MLKLPYRFLDAATEEYAKLAFMFARAALSGGKFYGQTNREVWSHCLDTGFMERMCVNNGCPWSFQHIFPVVRLYNSILDGTVLVERDHAMIRAYLEETHGKASLSLIEDVHAVRCSKKRLDEVATVDGACRGELGDFGLAAAKLWRQVHGARLGIGRAICGASDPIFKGKHASKKHASYQHIKKGVLKAAGHALLGSRVTRPGLGPGGRHIGGGPQPGTRTDKFWNPKFITQFQS